MDGTLTGGCQCGAVRYAVRGEPTHVSICHCADCRKSAGAPMVAWASFPKAMFAVTKGEPRAFNSSGTAFRHFCPVCGTGLYYVNEAVLPGLVDIQTATLDDPDALPPRLHVQTAEKIGWMDSMGALAQFERFPAAG